MDGRSEKSRCCRRRTCACCTAVWVLVASITVAIASGIVRYYFPQEFDAILNAEVALTPHSAAIKPWTNMPRSEYAIFVFDITNSYDVEHHGHKPILKELGPFKYYRETVKYDLYWNSDETLLQYSHNITYTNSPSAGLSDDISITTINMPLIGLLKLMEDIENNPKYEKWKAIFEKIFKTANWINEVLEIEPLFITRKVSEVLWGYEDPLYKLVHDLDPTMLPTANFSLMHRATHLFPNLVYTGKNESSLRDVYVMWNGLHEIREWGTPTARSFHNGTKAIFFSTNLKKNTTLYVFTDQIKMTGYFTYTKEVKVRGLDCYRYVYPREELDNTTMDRGFYPNGPSGVINLTAITPFNLPLFASKPHFLDGDPFYLRDVEGLHPNRSRHDSYIDVEPITGTVTSGVKQVQININVVNNKKYKELEAIPPYMMLPIFYTSESGEIQENQAQSLKSTLDGINYGTKAVLWTLIGITSFVSLLISFGFLMYLLWRFRKQRTESDRERTPLLTSSTTSLQ